MAGSPGKLQSNFTYGEIDPRLHEQTQTPYYSFGLAHAENVEIAPQGGFRVRDGLRDVGALATDAARGFAFDASDGSSYDLVFRPAEFAVWSASALEDTVTFTGLTGAMLPEMTTAQLLDTMLVFHEDLATKRIKHAAADDWSVDAAPYANVPNWDYGGPIGGGSYSNGVAAVWEIEFFTLTSGSTVFELEIAGETTLGITYNSTPATLIAAMEAAIEALPNVADGIGITNPSGNKFRIAFSGAGNEGDGWAVTGTVINKSDAAITATKVTAGVAPGEPVMSADRGWPQCGAFYGQRLLVGGFRGVPNAWAYSVLADYYNLDTRVTGADGAALIPMDTPGGEKIEHIVDHRFPVILTNYAEYWISERALDTTKPPNHVQASTKGVARGVPVVQSQGALLYTQSALDEENPYEEEPEDGVLAEFRYTDIEGNYVSQDVSLVASHLIADVVDQAGRPGRRSTDGNQHVIVKSDGSAVLGMLLRDQDPPMTAYARLTSGAGAFKAAWRNGRRQMSFIVERPDGRRLERFERGLLLDEATRVVNDPADAALAGVDRFDGRQCWVVADGDVFGPFVPTGGLITLPKAVSTADVGTWAPPGAVTLPLDRTVGPGIVNARKARIYKVTLDVIDTTSLAISTNGRALQDVDLRRYGMTADVPELEAGVTGKVTVTGLFGWSFSPYVTIGQVRPGRLNVRSINIHAKL